MNWFNKLFSKNKKEKTSNIGLRVLSSFLQSYNLPYSAYTQLKTYEDSLYVYACVSKIAQNVATLDWDLFKIKNTKGDVEEIYSHPLIDLIYKPNPLQTKTEFWEAVIISKKLTGNAFIYKIRNERGRVVELWNLPPNKITIVSSSASEIKYFKYSKDDGTELVILPEDMIHDKYPSPLETHLGISPLQPARIRVVIEDLANNYQKDFFYNNAKPDGVLSTAQRLSEEQVREIKKEWAKNYQGAGNNNKTAVLQGDLDYKQISISQREMDLIESMRFTRDDILVAFQVPKPIVAVTDDVNRANAESALVIFMSETVKPEMERIVERINEELVIPDFGMDLYFDFTDPTPEHRELKIKEYASSIRNGWRTINEVREIENLPPLEGGDLPVRPDRSQITDTEQNHYVMNRNNKMIKRNTKVFNYIKNKEELKKELKNTIKINYKNSKENKNKLNFKEYEKQLAGFITNKGFIMDRSINKFERTMKRYFAEQYKRFNEQFLLIEKGLKKNNWKKKVVEFIDEVNWKQELDFLVEIAEPLLAEIFEQRGIEAAKLIGEQFDVEQYRQTFIQERTIKFANYVNDTTQKLIKTAVSTGIQEGLSINKISDAISQVYESRIKNGSTTIARTEVAIAVGKADHSAYEQSTKIDRLQWITAGDDMVRESHAMVNRQIINKGDTYSNGLRYPGDENAEPGQVINCRCVEIALPNDYQGYNF